MSLQKWITEHRERYEKLYSKADFCGRRYGLALGDRIEYGIKGEIHKDLEARVGIRNAMTTTAALRKGWVRFSLRFGELEMQAFPCSKAAETIRHLVRTLGASSYRLELDNRHQYYEFETGAEVLEWLESHLV